MFIEKTYLFEKMRPELRDRVFALAEECSYAEGDHVFRRGDSADYLYILEEGRIRISVGDLAHDPKLRRSLRLVEPGRSRQLHGLGAVPERLYGPEAFRSSSR